MSFRIPFMYHPSLWVPSRDAADDFFGRVFGRRAVRQEEFVRKFTGSTNYPPDYCTWTMVADVWIDCIDPKRYIIDGKQVYPDVEGAGRLQGWGWYIVGMQSLYETLRARGIPVEDQDGVPATGERAPGTPAAQGYLPLFMAHLDDGLRYEFIEYFGDAPGVAGSGTPGVDERRDPEWTLRPLPGDPLGIERCSHHTVLTGHLDRARELMVDVLGGEVTHSGENALLGADSTYVRIADAVIELAVPKREGTLAWRDWERNGRDDTYHAISFKVGDLGQVGRHLTGCGVKIAARDDRTLVADPDTALGVPWGFTTAVV